MGVASPRSFPGGIVSGRVVEGHSGVCSGDGALPMPPFGATDSTAASWNEWMDGLL